MPSPSINIIGSGSVGHLWAAYLLDKHVNVRLYAKQPKASQQYTVQSPQRQFACKMPHHTLSNWKASEFIIVCVKATSLESLCVELKSYLKLQSINLSNTPVILMMNGLGIIEIAQQYLPETPIYQASTNHGARLEGLTLRHTGQGDTLIGNLVENDAETGSEIPITNLIAALNEALPNVRWNNNHQEALWTKLLINAIINPLTTIHKIQNGELLSNQKINQQAKRLTRQLEPFIQQFLPSQSWQSIFEKVELVANQTYTNVSSMRQDILMSRKTEIDFITGYLLKKAAEKQILLPEHEQIVNQIKILEKESKQSQDSVTL